MMLVVVLELLRGDGLTEVEGERVEDVVLGAGKRIGLPKATHVVRSVLLMCKTWLLRK